MALQQVTHRCLDLGQSRFDEGTSLTVLTPFLYFLVHLWPIASLPYQHSDPLNSLMVVVLLKLMQNFLLEILWQKKLVDFLPTIWTEKQTIQEEDTTPLLHQSMHLGAQSLPVSLAWHSVGAKSEAAYQWQSQLAEQHVQAYPFWWPTVGLQVTLFLAGLRPWFERLLPSVALTEHLHSCWCGLDDTAHCNQTWTVLQPSAAQ